MGIGGPFGQQYFANIIAASPHCTPFNHGRLGTSLRRLMDLPWTQKAAFLCRYFYHRYFLWFTSTSDGRYFCIDLGDPYILKARVPGVLTLRYTFFMSQFTHSFIFSNFHFFTLFFMRRRWLRTRSQCGTRVALGLPKDLSRTTKLWSVNELELGKKLILLLLCKFLFYSLYLDLARHPRCWERWERGETKTEHQDWQ